MTENKFGKRSNEKLNTCHTDMQKIMKKALANSMVDFGVSEGLRSVERQQDLYRIGRTYTNGKWVRTGKIVTSKDGVVNKSVHNFSPSKACDIYAYHADSEVRSKIMYSHVHLSYIAGVIQSSAKELLKEGSVSHRVRWGGNWDSDGVIIEDQNFDDLPHFELIKIK